MFNSFLSTSLASQAAFPQLFLSAAEVPRRRDAAAHATPCADHPTLRAPESLGAPGGRSSDVDSIFCKMQQYLHT